LYSHSVNFIKVARVYMMTLLIILVCVFAAVALMVILGERFGKPMDDEQQVKFGKISRILVFLILVAAIIKGLS